MLSLASFIRLCPGGDVLLNLFNPRGPTSPCDLEFAVYVREIDHPALQPARLAHCLEELEDLGLIVGWYAPPLDKWGVMEPLVKLTAEGHAVRSRLRELSRVRHSSDHVVRFDATEVVRRRAAAKGLARRDVTDTDAKVLGAVQRGRTITALNVFADLRRGDPKGLWKFTRVEAALTRLRDAGYLSGWRAPDAGLPHMPPTYRHPRRFKITPKGEAALRRLEKPAPPSPLLRREDGRLLGVVGTLGSAAREIHASELAYDPSRRGYTLAMLCADLQRFEALGLVKSWPCARFSGRGSRRYSITARGERVLPFLESPRGPL